MALTIKQEKFCNYYIEIGNASEAYRRAYDCKNMKDTSIVVKASELLSNGNISVRVNELKEKLQSNSDITKERILKELSSIVFADIRDYVEFDGKSSPKFKSFDKLTDAQAKAIESIKETANGIELKLHGKNWSMEKVCKMLGFDSPTVINQNINLSNVETTFE